MRGRERKEVYRKPAPLAKAEHAEEYVEKDPNSEGMQLPSLGRYMI